jgi:hypothetical protein
LCLSVSLVDDITALLRFDTIVLKQKG